MNPLMIYLLKEEKSFYIYVFLSLLFLFWKYKNNALSLLIVLLYFSGFAFIFDKGIENIYKVIVLGLAVYLIVKYNVLRGLRNKEKAFLFTFILFIGIFVLSGFLNSDSPNMIFSQLSKYLTPVCIFFLLNYFIKNTSEHALYYKDVFYTLLIIQVILAFFKWYIIGVQEWIVGSMTFMGGGEATPLPVLAFMLIWINKKGNLDRNDWMFVFLLLIIPFVSLKRAVWLIMPIFVMLFIYYVPRKISLKKVLYFLPFIPVIFYLGVRFNPTLNKEGKFGGSFDMDHVVKYVMVYNFGVKNGSNTFKLGEGRGGATLLIFNKLSQNKPLTSNDYFGYGLTKMYASDYETFDKYNFGINSKGAATGIVQTYVTSGYVGIVFTILLLAFIVSLIDNKRIRIVIGCFVFFDYFFYSGLVMRNPALSSLLFFIILYANQQFSGIDKQAAQAKNDFAIA